MLTAPRFFSVWWRLSERVWPVDVSAFGVALSRPSLLHGPHTMSNGRTCYVRSSRRGSPFLHQEGDVNLTTYLGTVKLTDTLFCQIGTSPSPKLSQRSSQGSAQVKSLIRDRVQLHPIFLFAVSSLHISYFFRLDADSIRL